jgi:hypothetical protein
MDMSDAPQIAMFAAFGAGGGAILSDFLHVPFLTLPLMLVGGGIGVAAATGLLGDVGDVTSILDGF